MTLHITPGSRDKNRLRKNLEAIKKYDSERITQVKALTDQRNEEFAILSGKYGLIRPEEEIPFHDEMVREMNISELLTHVKNFLQSRDIDEVIYYSADFEGESIPYLKLVKTACDALDINFEKRTTFQSS